MSTQRGFAPILIVLLLSVVMLGGGFFIFQKYSGSSSSKPIIIPSPTSYQIACPQDAKLCPDGSSVGRTGPNCEFTTCPTLESTSSTDTTNWKTYVNKKYRYSLKYPSEWDLGSNPGASLEETSNSNLIVLNGPINCERTKQHCGAVDVTVEKLLNQDLTISAKNYWLKINKKGPHKVDIINEENIQINGVTAYKVDYIFTPLNDQGQPYSSTAFSPVLLRTISLIDKNNFYQISIREQVYPQGKPIDPEDIPISEWQLTKLYDQIFSTFKFLP